MWTSIYKQLLMAKMYNTLTYSYISFIHTQVYYCYLKSLCVYVFVYKYFCLCLFTIKDLSAAGVLESWAVKRTVTFMYRKDLELLKQQKQQYFTLDEFTLTQHIEAF